MIDIEEIKGFAYRMLEDRLMEIPSADRQLVDGAALISAMSLGYNYGIKADRPQGEWIEVDDASISYRCSVCGWEAHLYEDDVYGMPYCPNCGAMMKGADDYEYERAIEQMEHDMLYEPTYNSEDGSM